MESNQLVLDWGERDGEEEVRFGFLLLLVCLVGWNAGFYFRNQLKIGFFKGSEPMGNKFGRRNDGIEEKKNRRGVT